MKSVRAVRNRNPGNIRVGDPWQGLAVVEEMTPEQASEDSFCVFKSPKWGFRAIARILIAGQDKRGTRTVGEIVRRWAPPIENDTEAYISHVARDTGFAADEALDLHSYAALAPVVKAISVHECGGWFFDDRDLDAGLRLAGVEAPVQGLAKSRTIKTAAAATVSVASLGGISETIEQVQPALSLMRELHDYWPAVAIAVLIAALGAVVWFRVDDWLRAK